MNTEAYPSIEITLDRFSPHLKPSYVEGILELHNVQKSVQIQIDLIAISPIIKAEGEFTIKQTDFQIQLYKVGFLEVEDPLKISFRLFFCETHKYQPQDDPLDDPLLQTILAEEKIIILTEPNFFGCEELKSR